MNKKFELLAFVLLFTSLSFAQSYGKNIPNFEYKKIHFGASPLGLNTTTYNYQLKEDIQFSDSVYHVALNAAPGFIFQIPTISWNLHSTFHIRFIPSISFHETSFEYRYWKNGVSKTKKTRVDPTVLNFPISFKLNTKRLNNFSAYAITGGSYTYDLTSQEDVDQSLSDPIVKLKKHDFAYHVGGGFDFYLPYFKLGLEIKLTNGLVNLLIQDDTFFSSPLASLKSQVWSFSITFEASR